MTLISTLTRDAVSSALLHSLWQDAVVGLLLWGALIGLRHATANARYLVCCSALGLMAALPIVTAIVVSDRVIADPRPVSAPVTAAAPTNELTPLDGVPSAPGTSSAGWFTSFTPWVLPVWLAGVLACSLRLVLAGAHTVVLRRRSDPEEGPIATAVSRLSARIGVRRSVSVRLS